MVGRRIAWAAGLVVAVAAAGAAPARAGGGPETTVVVVNADSPLSRRVANEYVRRRRIPAGHVCAVSGVPTFHVTDVETFRTKILAPIRLFLSDKRFADRIDLVAFSVDFPYGVNTSGDGPALGGIPPVASLTGLTYLERLVERKAAAEYQDFSSFEASPNGYFRRYAEFTHDGKAWGPRGFTSRAGWGQDEVPDPAAPADAPTRHHMAVMLGFAGTWGNSIPEILDCLASGSASDGTNPAGTVYLCRSTDKDRTPPRSQFFDLAVKGLEALGRKAVVLSTDDPGQTGVLPVGKDDVMGAVVGAADFSWKDCKSRLLPGSIAEHLTSFGAQFGSAGQTKCAEFLRFGAAGSCGTVAEPLNAPTKFPVPQMHVHYAAGCSLAEAFYQSLASPYQQLILGDPLARPFAKFAKVEIESLPAPVSGTVDVAAKVTAAEGRRVGRLELWIDGGFEAEGKPGARLRWDTTAADDGTHEVRVVAVEADPVETRSFAVATAVVSNTKSKRAAVTATLSRGPFAYDDAIPLSGRAPGAKSLEVWADGAKIAVATVSSDAWKAVVPAALFGMGTVPVQLRSVYADGPALGGPVIEIAVGAPAERRAVAPGPPPKPKGKGKAPAAPAGSKQGLRATLTDAAGKASEIVLPTLGGPGIDAVRKAIDAKGKGPWKKIAIEGELEVKAAGLYQLDVLFQGELAIDLDGKPLLEKRKAVGPAAAYGLARLEAGWHAISIAWAPGAFPDLTVLLAGDQVAAPLTGASLRPPSK